MLIVDPNVATFGIYVFYWMIRARRFAEWRILSGISSYWYYLTLLIPVYAKGVFFQSFSTAQRRVQAANVRPALPFWVAVVIFLTAPRCGDFRARILSLRSWAALR